MAELFRGSPRRGSISALPQTQPNCWQNYLHHPSSFLPSIVHYSFTYFLFSMKSLHHLLTNFPFDLIEKPQLFCCCLWFTLMDFASRPKEEVIFANTCWFMILLWQSSCSFVSKLAITPGKNFTAQYNVISFDEKYK
jgi:hypothetical protein